MSPPDYRDTVFLPKTDFPMKAGLPEKEPRILAKWQADDVYGQLRKARAGRQKFILHDGPPYANGDIHIGHAMQKTLKDLVIRTQSLLGKDVPFVPGWDCHGLPIEWKVEEEYRKHKRNKDEVPVAEFRAECRAYAQKWVDIQREQFKRLGIGGEWDKPYLTMDFSAEAVIVSELLKFANSGQLYRGAKPVMWSPVEKTALAEAEVEYADIVSTQIDVGFEIVESPIPELVGAHAVIWTTTPWTIPVNQAIAYGPEVEYVICPVCVTRPYGLKSLASSQELVLVRCEFSIGRIAQLQWLEHDTISPVAAKLQRLRPRRHHRPSPDAPPRRLLRPAAPVPARRLRHHRHRHRALSIWRPTMARTTSCCARRTASSRCSRSKAMAATAPTGCGWAAKAR